MVPFLSKLLEFFCKVLGATEKITELLRAYVLTTFKSHYKQSTDFLKFTSAKTDLQLSQ